MPLSLGSLKPPAAMISERFGARTLVEGIIGIIRTFRQVIAGFGFTSDQCASPAAAAARARLTPRRPAALPRAHQHRAAAPPLRRKSGALWLILHLPLCFVTLLLLSGMKNATICGNIGDALTNTFTSLDAVTAALASGIYSAGMPANGFLAVNGDADPDYATEIAA